MESIADRRVGISSIGRKIIELEEQKEQLEGETLDVEIQIEDTQKKVVSAETLKNSLTTFKELYEKATPVEKKELVRLQINQLIWSPNKIQIALFQGQLQPGWRPKFDKSRYLVTPRGVERKIKPRGKVYRLDV